MTDKQKERIKKIGLTEEDFEMKEVNPMDEIEAQVIFTALMTDTLLVREE